VTEDRGVLGDGLPAEATDVARAVALLDRITLALGVVALAATVVRSVRGR